MAVQLQSHGYSTLDDLANLTTDELVNQMPNMDYCEARKIISAAKASIIFIDFKFNQSFNQIYLHSCSSLQMLVLDDVETLLVTAYNRLKKIS